MFIYSFKASSIKFFGILCVAMAALITLIAFVPAYAGDGGSTGGGIAVDAEKLDTAGFEGVNEHTRDLRSKDNWYILCGGRGKYELQDTRYKIQDTR